jgi:signal peptidase II
MSKQIFGRDRNQMPGLRHYVRTAPLLALISLGLDQLTKLCVRETLLLGESIPHDGRLRITYVTNPGMAFGIPASSSVSLLLPLAMILVALVIYWRFERSRSTLLNVGTGLFIGGTLGNLVDRATLGHVTDFIDVVTSGGTVSTVFNLADLCIIVGIVLLEVFLIRFIVRIIMEKGLNYNPVKPLIAKIIQGRRSKDKD